MRASAEVKVEWLKAAQELHAIAAGSSRRVRSQASATLRSIWPLRGLLPCSCSAPRTSPGLPPAASIAAFFSLLRSAPPPFSCCGAATRSTSRPDNEARRLAEEDFAGLPFTAVTAPWHAPILRTRFTRWQETDRIAADTTAEGASLLLEQRASLTDTEIERYRWLGRNTAQVTAACCNLSNRESPNAPWLRASLPASSNAGSSPPSS